MRIIKPLIFVWSNSTIAKNSITVFFYMLGYNLYFQIMSLYLHQEFHYGIAMISEFFIVMGLCYIIGMYVLHPQVNKYLSTNRAISLSLLLLMMIMLILDLNESNIFIITLLSKIWVMWLANLMFFLVSPIAAINLNNRFIGICQSQNSNNGIIMGGISQLTSISLIFGSILISFYSIFGVSILLVVSVFMLVAFLAMTMSLKDNTSLDLNTSHEA